MTDDQLERALRVWRPVAAPAALRARILRPDPARPRPWWPVAVAATLCIAVTGFSRAADRRWNDVSQPSSLTIDDVHRVLHRDVDPEAPLDQLSDALQIDASHRVAGSAFSPTGELLEAP